MFNCANHLPSQGQSTEQSGSIYIYFKHVVFRCNFKYSYFNFNFINFRSLSIMGNIDSIPILSQTKALVQVISGDEDGAAETMNNFAETGIIASQFTSLAHAIDGDMDEARRVQERFGKGMESFSEGLPGVGHIKGVVHHALGQHEKGNQVFKSSSGGALTIPAAVAGTIACGPACGAAASVAASHAYDGIVTGIDTAVNGHRSDGSPRYYGSWDSYDRMSKGKASVGEIFDTSAGIAMDAVGGATGGKIVGKGWKPFAKAVGREFRDSIPGAGYVGRKMFKTRRVSYRRPIQRRVSYRRPIQRRVSYRRPMQRRIHCRGRRNIDFNLTTEESAFANRHLQLDTKAGDVINKDWRNMTVPDTVSNIVSLFVILKLILWNDSNGRRYVC